MADSPQPGGWIKLWRSMKENGHLQMPDRAFKLFVYLLLQVNHKAAYGLQPGEGWITYQMIREECCEAGRPPWNKSTVSLALRFLKTHGYIECIKATKGLAQRIRILNWDKYQGDSGPETGQVSGPVTGPLTGQVGGQVGGPVTGQVTGPKQERTRTTNKAKKVKNETPPEREPPLAPQPPPETLEPNEAQPTEAKEVQPWRVLSAAVWNFMQARDALPPTQKDQDKWWTINTRAAKEMVDADGGRPLQDWLAQLEWLGGQPRYSAKVTSCNMLRALWSEYQLQLRQGEREPARGKFNRQVPPNSNVFLHRGGPQKERPGEYDHIYKRFDTPTGTGGQGNET